MKQKIADYVKVLLERGSITGFLGLRDQGGVIAPHLFTKPDELDLLSLGDKQAPGDSRYPLIKMLNRLMKAAPGKKFGLLVRGCDERAVRRLINDDRVEPLDGKRVLMVGFSCPPELAEKCRCSKPWPDALAAGEKTPAFEPDDDDAPPQDLMVELNNWFDTFDRCLKCFGCRDSCPVCSCLECTMEEESLIPQRELPTSRNFLMTRALHMVDRCVYCGLCEQACPANIPLKDLYRLVARMAGGARGATQAA